jgi:hypothetical protein
MIGEGHDGEDGGIRGAQTLHADRHYVPLQKVTIAKDSFQDYESFVHVVVKRDVNNVPIFA